MCNKPIGGCQSAEAVAAAKFVHFVVNSVHKIHLIINLLRSVMLLFAKKLCHCATVLANPNNLLMLLPYGYVEPIG